LKIWNKIEEESHSRELQADTLSIILIYGTKKFLSGKKSRGSPELNKIAIGPLLYFTMMGQLTEDVTISSETHPSILTRYEHCCNVICDISGIERYNLDPLEWFQLLLYRTQGCGLGRFITEKWESFPGIF
jgi:hypothetical protein